MRTLDMAASLYLQAGLLLALSFAAWAIAHRMLSGSGPTPPASWVRLGRTLIVLSLALPAAVRLLPPSAVSPASTARLQDDAGPAGPLEAGVASVRRMLPARPFRGTPPPLAVVVVGSLSLLALARLGWRTERLARYLRQLPVVRRHRRVRLVASSLDSVPYAARSGRTAYVVLPVATLLDRDHLRLFVAHELQHHRQADTLWAYLLEGIRAAYFWNPAALLWTRRLGREQELACDAALIGRRREGAAEYARCLVRAAAEPAPRLFAAAGSLATPAAHPSHLRRRIEMLLDDRKPRRGMVPLAGAACILALSAASLTARATASPGALTADDLRVLVRTRASQFEVPAHRAVLRELNAMLASPEEREKRRAGLARMAEHQEMVQAALQRHRLPLELRAVPLVESGYENRLADPAEPFGPHGAGLWMFIAPTARSYALRVDDGIDERLDPERESEAAARMLSRLHAEFGDWALALAAYNQGSRKVKAVLQAGGDHDPWTLIDEGQLAPYAATVMAAVILTENPSLLDRN